MGALLVKALALALREVPELNGFWTEGAFHPSADIHLGLAIYRDVVASLATSPSRPREVTKTFCPWARIASGSPSSRPTGAPLIERIPPKFDCTRTPTE